MCNPLRPSEMPAAIRAQLRAARYHNRLAIAERRMHREARRELRQAIRADRWRVPQTVGVRCRIERTAAGIALHRLLRDNRMRVARELRALLQSAGRT